MASDSYATYPNASSESDWFTVQQSTDQSTWNELPGSSISSFDTDVDNAFGATFFDTNTVNWDQVFNPPLDLPFSSDLHLSPHSPAPTDGASCSKSFMDLGYLTSLTDMSSTNSPHSGNPSVYHSSGSSNLDLFDPALTPSTASFSDVGFSSSVNSPSFPLNPGLSYPTAPSHSDGGLQLQHGAPLSAAAAEVQMCYIGPVQGVGSNEDTFPFVPTTPVPVSPSSVAEEPSAPGKKKTSSKKRAHDEDRPAKRRRVQDNTPRFKCEECDAVFGRTHNLKVHIDDVHRNVRKYKCPEPGCDKALKRAFDLKRHYQSAHTDGPSPRRKTDKPKKK